MFNERKAEKINNLLDTVFDILLEFGVSKPIMNKLLDFQVDLSNEFDRMANDINPFED